MSTGTEQRKPAACLPVVNHGREYSKARKGDVEYPRFSAEPPPPFLGSVHE